MIEKEKLLETWLEEERCAHIKGWNFSHINDRYTEETDLPWNYQSMILQYLKPTDQLLDIDTGGGEFLLSLSHPYGHTSCTEGYDPNIQLCAKTLLPLGIDFKEAKDVGHLPFEDERFDIIINRHGDFNIRELYRLLKPNGLFITEQVGDRNDRDLAKLLLPASKSPFEHLNLRDQSALFKAEGFSLLEAQEAFRPIRFFDVGALVWFAHIIEWEFPGFSVKKCLPQLEIAQQLLEKHGSIDGTIHRYLIVAKKKG